MEPGNGQDMYRTCIFVVFIGAFGNVVPLAQQEGLDHSEFIVPEIFLLQF